MSNEHVQAPLNANRAVATGDERTAAAEAPSRTASPQPSRGPGRFGSGFPDEISFSRDNLLFLQRTVGNRPVVKLLQKKAHVQPTSSHGDVIQRQGPVATPAVTFSEMTVIPGGLATGKPRSTQKVFRGDTVQFVATHKHVDPGLVDTGLEGRVEGTARAEMAWSGNKHTWRVIVGNMGIPSKPGQPPDNVDAKPWMQIKAPSVDAGMRFEKTYSFKVVADLQWLSDRADIAGGQIDAAYLGGVKSLKAAFAPYKAAYKAHQKALENKSRRERLAQDIVLGIFLAGFGGAAGGVVQQLIRGESRELIAIGVGTAIGDITKYVIRLGGTLSGGSPGGGGHGTETPGVDPTAGKGSAKGGAGFEPDDWLTDRERAFAEEGQRTKQRCVDLKKALSEAWAAGKTDLMDQDPVDIIAPHEAQLTAPLPVKTQQEYATGLWRTWLTNYGFAIKEGRASPGGGYHMEDTTDSGLRDEIKSQCGGDAVLTEVRGSQILEANRMTREFVKATWEKEHPGQTYPEPDPRRWGLDK